MRRCALPIGHQLGTALVVLTALGAGTPSATADSDGDSPPHGPTAFLSAPTSAEVTNAGWLAGLQRGLKDGEYQEASHTRLRLQAPDPATGEKTLPK